MRKQIGVNLLVCFVGIIFSLVVLELVFRVIPKGSSKSSWSDRPKTYFLAEDSARESQNADYKITVVGDSFTYGPHLQIEDTFAKRLERWLNLNKSKKLVEVKNVGVSGSNTVNQLSTIKSLLVNKSADLIVLEITLNDAEPHPLTKQEKDLYYGNSWSKFSIFSYWQTLKFVATRLHNSETHRRFIEYHTKFWTTPETFKAFDNSVKTIKSLCEQSSVKLAAFIFPLVDFPLDQSYPFNKVHQIISKVLSDAKIPYFDLFENLKNIPNQRLQVIPGKDHHPNEIANRIAAERLVKFLSKRALIPEEFVPTNTLKHR